MECKEANMLMMKYMDSIISENEAKTLNSHIKICVSCKDDFVMYERMMVEFETESFQIFEPPCDIEKAIMTKVYTIEPEYSKAHSAESVLGFVVGIFSVMFGGGFLLTMYQSDIIAATASYPYIGKLFEGAAYISDKAAEISTRVVDASLSYFNNFNTLIDGAKYVILALIVALVVAQYVLYSKNKVEV